MNLELLRVTNGLERSDIHKASHSLPDAARDVMAITPVGVKAMVASLKNGTTTYCESLPEYRVALMKEVDPTVVSYAMQPQTFEFIINGVRRKYTPDFLVKYRDGSMEYLEVKLDFRARKPEYQEIEKAMAKLCLDMGVGFRTVTERDFAKQPKLANVERLFEAKMFDLAYADRLKIAEYLDKHPKVSAKDIAEVLGDTVHLALQKLLHLTVWGHLRLDINTKITVHSMFWLPGDAQ